MNYNNEKQERIDIFFDTEKLCKSNQKLKESIRNSVEKQQLILETDSLSVPSLARFQKTATVVVSKKRSFEAASAYKGEKTAVHNFASASNPGGGVTNGASAQEECLCRCSGLYFCLSTPTMYAGFYNPHRNAHDPIHNGDIIYTPAVTVFKSDTRCPKLIPESEWYDVDIITCAAPNLRNQPSNRYNSGDGDKAAFVDDDRLYEIHVARLRRILDVAVTNGDEVVILGAFGCGAFMNNPEVVARAAKDVVKEYLYAFKTIEFAVYCTPKDDTNYKVFDRAMKGI